MLYNPLPLQVVVATGLLMDVSLTLNLMAVLSPVVATTLPTLVAWWYVPSSSVPELRSDVLLATA